MRVWRFNELQSWKDYGNTEQGYEKYPYFKHYLKEDDINDIRNILNIAKDEGLKTSMDYQYNGSYPYYLNITISRLSHVTGYPIRWQEIDGDVPTELASMDTLLSSSQEIFDRIHNMEYQDVSIEIWYLKENGENYTTQTVDNLSKIDFTNIIDVVKTVIFIKTEYLPK